MGESGPLSTGEAPLTYGGVDYGNVGYDTKKPIFSVCDSQGLGLESDDEIMADEIAASLVSYHI